MYKFSKFYANKIHSDILTCFSVLELQNAEPVFESSMTSTPQKYTQYGGPFLFQCIRA